MPLNKEGEEVEYTTDEDVGYMLESKTVDYCVEYTGFLEEVYGIAQVGAEGKKFDLFKAIISNGSKRMVLLIWDADLQAKYQPDFTSRQILHIDGGQGQNVTARKFHKENNCLAYEIIIQKKTIVTLLGTHDPPRPVRAPLATIDFLDILKAEGEFMVKAYIKTVPVRASTKAGNMSFESGSLTNGQYKMPVQISSFAEDMVATLDKRVCVMVRGTLSDSALTGLTVLCQDGSYIQVLEDEPPLTLKQVSMANRPLKRNNNADGNSDFKKQCIHLSTKGGDDQDSLKIGLDVEMVEKNGNGNN